MKCEVKAVTIQIQSLSNLSKAIRNASYTIDIFYGSSRDKTEQLNYFVYAPEIAINQVIHLTSIHSNTIEFWLSNAQTKKMIGVGIYDMRTHTEGFHLLDLQIAKNIVAVLRLNIELHNYDIYKKVILEDDELILKKDDTDILRQEKEKQEKEEQEKKAREEQANLLLAQKKQAILTLSTKYVQNQSYF